MTKRHALRRFVNIAEVNNSVTAPASAAGAVCARSPANWIV